MYFGTTSKYAIRLLLLESPQKAFSVHDQSAAQCELIAYQMSTSYHPSFFKNFKGQKFQKVTTYWFAEDSVLERFVYQFFLNHY